MYRCKKIKQQKNCTGVRHCSLLVSIDKPMHRSDLGSIWNIVHHMPLTHSFVFWPHNTLIDCGWEHGWKTTVRSSSNEMGRLSKGLVVLQILRGRKGRAVPKPIICARSDQKADHDSQTYENDNIYIHRERERESKIVLIWSIDNM